MINRLNLKDQVILKGLKKDDKKAFEIMFREYFDSLHEYALFYVRNSQQAEDIVQDVFFNIWNSRKHLTIKSSLKGYLYRSIHNYCIQYLRHLTVEKNHKAIHKIKYEEIQLMNRLYFETGLSNLFRDDIKSLVAEAIECLPEKTYEIFLLSRHKGLKNNEIAKKFDVSEKSVEYHITKALNLLRDKLKEFLPVILLFSVIGTI